MNNIHFSRPDQSERWDRLSLSPCLVYFSLFYFGAWYFFVDICISMQGFLLFLDCFVPPNDSRCIHGEAHSWHQNSQVWSTLPNIIIIINVSFQVQFTAIFFFWFCFFMSKQWQCFSTWFQFFFQYFLFFYMFTFVKNPWLLSDEQVPASVSSLLPAMIQRLMRAPNFSQWIFTFLFLTILHFIFFHLLCLLKLISLISWGEVIKLMKQQLNETLESFFYCTWIFFACLLRVGVTVLIWLLLNR